MNRSPNVSDYELPYAPTRIGHTWSLTDAEEPIYTAESDTVYPPNSFVNAFCSGCDAKNAVQRATKGVTDYNLVIVAHQPNCLWAVEHLPRR